MIPTETLQRSIGVDGRDGVNKTRFALHIAGLLEEHDAKVMYVGFPFIPGSVTGALIKNIQKVKPLGRPMLYVANRLELLPVASKWLEERTNHWVIFDRTKMADVYSHYLFPEMSMDWFMQIESLFPNLALNILVHRPLWESREILRKRKAATHQANKRSFDEDLPLQKAVGKMYREMTRGRENWISFRVKGIAHGAEDFYDWEVRYVQKLWNRICRSFQRPQWRTDRGVIEKVVREVGLDTDKQVKKRIQFTRSRLKQQLYGVQVFQYPKRGDFTV